MQGLEKVKKTKLLIVEGKEDEYFFTALMSHLLLDDIQVMPIGGKTLLRDSVEALSLAPNFNKVITLGITRDADDNPSGAFQSVCDAISNANLRPPSKQLSVANGKPRTVIMILPKPGITGTLEDVCLDSVANTPEMECLTEHLDCIKEKTGNLPDDLSKAKIHALLATKSEPGLRLGEAAQKGYWQWDNTAFEQIKQFLKLL